MKRNASKQQKNNTPAAKRVTMETVDVVYKCGHQGQRREIVGDGIEQHLAWVRRNVKCKACYEIEGA